MQLDWPILSVLVWLPIAAGVLLLLVGDRGLAVGRWLALAASLATFAISVLLWREFDPATASMQFFEQQPWIGAFNAWYTLGVDGISMPLIVLTAFISPYRNDRTQARTLNDPGRFFEVYCKCSLEACEKRDPKGLYRRARKGEVKEFTGVTAPYEEPEDPEIVVETDKHGLDECVSKILGFLEKQEVIPAPTPQSS
mgnify:CR=1 FL=1